MYVREIEALKALPVSAKHIYTTIHCLERFDNDTGTAPFSVTLLAEVSHLAPNTVRAACHVLQSAGLLLVQGNEAALPLYAECRAIEASYTYIPSIALDGLARYVRAALPAYYDFALQLFNQLRVPDADPHYTYATLTRTYRLGSRRSRIRKYLGYLRDAIVAFPGKNRDVLHFRYEKDAHMRDSERNEWLLKREMKEILRPAVPTYLNAVVARMWDYIKLKRLQGELARRVAREFVTSIADLREPVRKPVAFVIAFLRRLDLSFYLDAA
ncbi:hypothetical protein [Alicyclobacillus macrosporangiidus]|uniref:Uncharacterized protein n=1 Tax=Alicyclobacillus macrosporangiidus TaxID=392015 RepID=A0A1I7L2M0_9BACL|nr:hypothetical protein [Alicyclobacillus macrosporangiidus]SFV03937.1 hypothetical protein SAMN05421543_12362 [Alicyclobacillus macrosporangiidus]